MDTAEKYIYRVYLEKSFSKAAETLFISQPSLSAAVSHRERELGFRIFDRSTKPVSLTPEGHVYLDMLEEIMESERNMHLRLQSLSEDKCHSIAIGGSTSTVYYLLPSICGEFYRTHPDVAVTLDLGSVISASPLMERLTFFQKLDRGDLDAVLCYDYDRGKHRGHKICSERLAVAMRQELVPPSLLPFAVSREELISGSFSSAAEIAEKHAFREIPFLDFPRKGNTGRFMTNLLGEYSVTAHRIANAGHAVVHFNMMCAGVGALLTCDYIAALLGSNADRVVYFVFPKEQSTRNVYLVTRQETPSRAMQDFLRTAQSVGLHPEIQKK